MLTVLATLPFLVAGLAAAMILADSLGRDRSKIFAALRGESLLSRPAVSTRRVTVQFSSRPVSRPVSVEPRWRVAA